MIFKSFCLLCGIHFSYFQSLLYIKRFHSHTSLPLLRWPCIALGTGQVEVFPFLNVLLHSVDQNTILVTAHLECLTK